MAVKVETKGNTDSLILRKSLGTEAFTTDMITAGRAWHSGNPENRKLRWVKTVAAAFQTHRKAVSLKSPILGPLVLSFEASFIKGTTVKRSVPLTGSYPPSDREGRSLHLCHRLPSP